MAIMDFVEQHPMLTLGGGIVGLVVIGGLIISKTNPAASTTGTTSDTSGLKNGIVYVPTQTNFSTYNRQYNSGNTTTTTGGTTTTNYPPPAPPPIQVCKPGFQFQSGKLGILVVKGSYAVAGGYCVPVTTAHRNPPPPTTTKTGKIRAKNTPPSNTGWDSTHTGVPIRPSPGGAGVAISGYAPFGSSVSITGGPVTGSPNDAGGSTSWFQTAQGYISAADFASIS